MFQILQLFEEPKSFHILLPTAAHHLVLPLLNEVVSKATSGTFDVDELVSFEQLESIIILFC